MLFSKSRVIIASVNNSSFAPKLNARIVFSQNNQQCGQLPTSFGLFPQTRLMATDKKQSKKPEPVKKEPTPEQIQKEIKIKQMLSDAGRKKPIRRDLQVSVRKSEKKVLPPESILLYRSYQELEKLEIPFGVIPPLEPLPYPDHFLDQRRKNRNKRERLESKNRTETASDETTKASPPPRITVHELHQLISSSKSPLLIDLRERIVTEVEPAIPGSISFPTLRSSDSKKPRKVEERSQFLADCLKLHSQQFQLKYKVPPIPKNASIVFYSNIGLRSDEVTNYAIRLGFVDSKSLYGGARLYNKYYSNFSPKKSTTQEEQQQQQQEGENQGEQ